MKRPSHYWKRFIRAIRATKLESAKSRLNIRNINLQREAEEGGGGGVGGRE